MNNWIELINEKDLPPECTVVLGFSEKWIDEDFEPEGIRECFYNDGEWSSARWNNDQDSWFNDWETKPTHWMQRPSNPLSQKVKVEDVFKAWQRIRTAAVSKMFDGVNQIGIFPTSEFYKTIDEAFIDGIKEINPLPSPPSSTLQEKDVEGQLNPELVSIEEKKPTNFKDNDVAGDENLVTVEQDFKELNISLDYLCVQKTKDAGHSWIEFSDKFRAFERKVVSLLNQKPENKTQTSIQEKEQDMGTCRESNCKEKAVIDYNGHGHFVCQPHYENTFKSDKSSH